MIYTLTVAPTDRTFLPGQHPLRAFLVRSCGSRIKLHSHFTHSVEKVHELCQLYASPGPVISASTRPHSGLRERLNISRPFPRDQMKTLAVQKELTG